MDHISITNCTFVEVFIDEYMPNYDTKLHEVLSNREMVLNILFPVRFR